MQEKNLISLFLVNIAAGIIAGCSGNSEATFFDRELNYTYAEVKESFIFDEILNPWTIQHIDGKIYIADIDHPETPVHRLQIDPVNSSLLYEQGLGSRGQGPGEFLEVNDFVNAGSSVYIYDGQQLKLIKYDKEQGELSHDDDIHLRTTGRMTTLFATQENNFVGIGLFFADRFIILNSEGETIAEHGEQIKFNNNFAERDLALGWISHGVVKPKDDFVYLFSHHADFIEKYHTDGQLILRIQGDENPLPDMEIRNEWPFNAGKLSYLDVTMNNDHIYALYSGQSWDETGLQGNIIHKLDWDLNLVEAYELEQFHYKFTVDNDGNLYTFSETDRGIEFYQYELK